MTADSTDQNNPPESPESIDTPQSASGENASGAMTCIECGTEYSFTPEQKQEFASRGFQPPKRCSECRMKRRRKRTGGEGSKEGGRENPREHSQEQQPREASRENSRDNSRDQQPRRRNRQNSPHENRQGSRPNRPVQQPGNDPGSFVAQGEAERFRRQSRFDDPEDPPHMSVKANNAWNRPGDPNDPALDDNFGNSIHYKGPGVDTRFGTAWDGGPNYAPWEGAHGYLLTHHEAEMKRKQNQQNRNNRNDRNDRNDRNGNEQKRSGRSNNNNNNRKKENGGGRNRRQAFDIVCATCGTATQVPFKPIPGKAVYCRDCYRKARQENAPANTGESAAAPAVAADSEDLSSE